MFLVLAYGLSWWPWPLIDRAAQPDAALMIPIGPSLAALLVLAWTSGRAGVRALLRSVVHMRLGRWWAVVVLPPLVAAAGAGVALAAGASAPSAGDVMSVLAASVIAFPVLLVLGGPLGEELGWRGYVLPTLLRHVGPVTATLLLTPMWLVFHLPWIINRPERYGIPWALMVVGFAFTLTWLQSRTGSVGLAVLFHAVVNSSSAVAVQSFATVDRPLVWNAMAGLWLAVGLALAVGPLRAPSMTSPPPPGAQLSRMVS
jgi:membrane protease YdiL (CAAX protease family)